MLQLSLWTIVVLRIGLRHTNGRSVVAAPHLQRCPFYEVTSAEQGSLTPDPVHRRRIRARAGDQLSCIVFTVTGCFGAPSPVDGSSTPSLAMASRVFSPASSTVPKMVYCGGSWESP